MRGARLVLLSLAGPRDSLSEPAQRWVEALSAVRVVEAHIINRQDGGQLAAILATEHAPLAGAPNQGATAGASRHHRRARDVGPAVRDERRKTTTPSTPEERCDGTPQA